MTPAWLWMTRQRSNNWLVVTFIWGDAVCVRQCQLLWVPSGPRGNVSCGPDLEAWSHRWIVLTDVCLSHWWYFMNADRLVTAVMPTVLWSVTALCITQIWRPQPPFWFSFGASVWIGAIITSHWLSSFVFFLGFFRRLLFLKSCF